MSAAPPTVRQTRNTATLTSDIASLTAREKLIFAQAVYEFGVGGTKAWTDISRLLSRHPLLTGRGDKFFTPQFCPVIYNELMNEAELESSEANESPRAPTHLKLAQKHYVTRVQELKEQIALEEAKFRVLVREIDDIKAGKWDQMILQQFGITPSVAADSCATSNHPREVEDAQKSEIVIKDKPDEQELEQEEDIDEVVDREDLEVPNVVEEIEDASQQFQDEMPRSVEDLHENHSNIRDVFVDEEQPRVVEEEEEIEISTEDVGELDNEEHDESKKSKNHVESYDDSRVEDEVINEEEDIVEQSTPVVSEDVQNESDEDIIELEEEMDNEVIDVETSPALQHDLLPSIIAKEVHEENVDSDVDSDVDVDVDAVVDADDTNEQHAEGRVEEQVEEHVEDHVEKIDVEDVTVINIDSSSEDIEMEEIMEEITTEVRPDAPSSIIEEEVDVESISDEDQREVYTDVQVEEVLVEQERMVVEEDQKVVEEEEKITEEEDQEVVEEDQKIVEDVEKITEEEDQEVVEEDQKIVEEEKITEEEDQEVVEEDDKVVEEDKTDAELPSIIEEIEEPSTPRPTHSVPELFTEEQNEEESVEPIEIDEVTEEADTTVEKDKSTTEVQEQDIVETQEQNIVETREQDIVIETIDVQVVDESAAIAEAERRDVTPHIDEVAMQEEPVEVHDEVQQEKEKEDIQQGMVDAEKEEKQETTPRVSSRLRTKREHKQQHAEEDASITAAPVPLAPAVVAIVEKNEPPRASDEPPVKRPRGRPRKIRPPEPQPQVPKEPEVKIKTRSMSRGTVDSVREKASPMVDVVGDGYVEMAEQDKAEADANSIQRRRDGKRKADEVDDNHIDGRGRKRAREANEQSGAEETAGSPVAPADPPFQSKADRKRFQQLIYMLHSQISQHRNGNIFHNPIKKSEAPDYHEIVKRPTDLKTIKAKVRDGLINSTLEYQRDIYLMFANSLMYNRPHSDIYTLAEEMMLESEAHINAFQQTEGYMRTRS